MVGTVESHFAGVTVNGQVADDALPDPVSVAVRQLLHFVQSDDRRHSK